MTDRSRLAGIFMLLATLAACGGDEQRKGVPTEEASAAAAASPAALARADLGACPNAEPADYRERTKPIAVPAEFSGLAQSDMDHFAFTTLAGNTVCVDTSWIESIDKPEVSPDRRFLAFDWLGYEAFGHIVVDRTGEGQVIDTGNRPAPSPSGKRLAAVDLSESAFGSLNAFAVWQVEPVGLGQLAATDQDLPSGDWRIDGWQGDSCVRLSLVPIDRQPGDYRDMDKVPRDPWFAAENSEWQPMAGNCPRA